MREDCSILPINNVPRGELNSPRRPGGHGIWRFFAQETISRAGYAAAVQVECQGAVSRRAKRGAKFRGWLHAYKYIIMPSGRCRCYLVQGVS